MTSTAWPITKPALASVPMTPPVAAARFWPRDSIRAGSGRFHCCAVLTRTKTMMTSDQTISAMSAPTNPVCELPLMPSRNPPTSRDVSVTTRAISRHSQTRRSQ